ncbi:MAG: fatty acid desaturase [Burkholderiales bacterium]|nr:fatty acid desaturase [Burkholderiales bacterium]
MKYLKFTLFPIASLVITFMMLQGGNWMYSGLATLLVLLVFGDALLPEDLSEEHYEATGFLNLMLYVQLPILLLATTLAVSTASTGDILSIKPVMLDTFGLDLERTREISNSLQWLAALMAFGFMYGAGGTNVAHELIHRTYSARDLVIGRWLLAFTGDASFSIEHVYGHHKNLATPKDPATAQRGDSVYRFIVKSTVGSYESAWGLERERLKKFGYSVWNPVSSRMIRGNLMTLSIAAWCFYLGGWMGVGMFVLMGFVGKSLLEIVNYMEHYGLVRRPEDKVEPRHSWNSNKWMSTSFLYALPRHSHHHAEADKEYWHLRAYPHAPMMPYGYLSMILIALFPPIFRRMMEPLLADWDNRFATPAEKTLAQQANRAKNDKQRRMIRIASTDIEVEHNREREVILNTALKQGLGFPHNCRVGSCTQCKCKLKSGRVMELTDSSYVLSAEDLASGMILACQSVPLTDVEIEVQLSSTNGCKLVDTRGEITATRLLTHDIMEIKVALDEPMEYRAGQFAEIRLNEFSLSRNYSIAVAPRGKPQSELVFHVRKVPGGRFTEWLFQASRVGTRFDVSGPFGEFYLREADAESDIVCIAGGSGMAPVKALLEQAAWTGITRTVHYAFGARTQSDLYCTNEMVALGREWRGTLNFTPVLSAEPTGSDWQGQRGMVTQALTEKSVHWSNAQAYLCGPPAMIEAATQCLLQLGVKPDMIFADAFLDSSHTNPASEKQNLTDSVCSVV